MARHPVCTPCPAGPGTPPKPGRPYGPWSAPSPMQSLRSPSSPDGHTYSKQALRSLMASCKERGLPVTSCRRRAGSVAAGGAARRSELAAREVNRRAGPSVCAARWQPARAARCHARWIAASPGCRGGGGELGEELCARAPEMTPLLPRAENICTRFSIHMRLRRSDRALPPTLEVFNLTTITTERGPHVIAAQSGAADVSEEMGRII